MSTETTPILTESARRRQYPLPDMTSTAHRASSIRDQVIPEEPRKGRSARSEHGIVRRWSKDTSGITDAETEQSTVAPRCTLPSLDFDRVVNSYSMMATKKRLRKRLKLAPSTSNWDKATASQEERDFDSNGRRQWAARRRPDGKQVVMWILTLCVGLLCGLVAVFILDCVKRIVNFRVAVLNHMLELMEHPNSTDHMNPKDWFGKLVGWVCGSGPRGLVLQHQMPGLLALFCLYNLLLACTSSLLCLLYAPNAIGSGIPEAKAYLNGVCVPSFADASTFVVKIVGTILSVSSGLIVGPEGPLVHVGAMIGQGLTKSTRLDVAIHRLQANFPILSRWCGCSSLDAFGDDGVAPTPRNDNIGVLGSKVFETKRNRQRATQHLQEGLATLGSDDADNPESHGLLSPERLDEVETSARDEEERSVSTTLCYSCQNGARCRTPRNFILSQFASVLSRFRNDTDRRDLISIGVAVGFAAAFGAPVGGLLYSMEEASSFFTLSLMWRMLAATAIGTLVIAVYHGDLTEFSVLSLGQSEMEHETPMKHFQEMPYYIILGTCGGLLGAFFNACYRSMNRRRKQFYSHPRMSGWRLTGAKLAQVAVISLITSSITFLLPLALPHSWVCRDMRLETSYDPESVNAYFDRFTCDEGHINAIAVILLGSRDDALNTILTDPSKFGPGILLVCGLTCFFLLIVTFGVALPMGLFMPTLLTGSSFGGAAGLLIKTHLVSSVVPSDMALVCATSMLAGVQRSTVSLCVIMMEATGQTKVLIPLIIAVVMARYIGDFFNEGFYHIEMELKEYPFLEHRVKAAFDICSVADVMTSPVVTVREIETAGALEQLLLSTSAEGFPVIKETTKEYVGLIRRDQLVALLECNIFMEETKADERNSLAISNVMQRAKKKTFDHVLFRDDDVYADRARRTARSGNVDWLQENVLKSEQGNHVMIGGDEILPEGASIISVGSTSVKFGPEGSLIVHVSLADVHKHVDISAAMNRGAYTVVENTPLSKAYGLFSALGLHYLTVLGDGKVVGILTRSNFMIDFMSRRTGIDFHH